MTLDADVMQRIIKEVTLDLPPRRPEGDEEAAFRKAVERDIVEARKEAREFGVTLVIDFTPEIPDLD